MYSIKVDELGKKLLIESLRSQMNILEKAIIEGNESTEYIDLHKNLSKLMNGILYTKSINIDEQALKRGGTLRPPSDDSFSEIPN